MMRSWYAVALMLAVPCAVLQGFGISRCVGVFWWIQSHWAGSAFSRRAAGL